MIDSSLYASQGVKIDPVVPSAQDSVRITYDGLLAQSGATEVYAHVGYDDWKEVRDYRMNRAGHGFEVSLVPPSDAGRVSLCFRDAANNWDNNSGLNYSFPLEGRSSYDVYSPERYLRDNSYRYWDADPADYHGYTARSGEAFGDSWVGNPVEASAVAEWGDASPDNDLYPEENEGRRSPYRSKTL